MAIEIPDPSTGRKTPLATSIRTADQAGFGNKVATPSPIGFASEQAFGDSSGQQAMANAKGNVGSVFFDVGMRHDALTKAEDDAEWKNRVDRFQIEEIKIRGDIEMEQTSNFRNADQKLAEWHKRMEQSRDTIFNADGEGSYEFKHKTQERIDFDIDMLVDERHDNYKYGKDVLGFRAQQVAAKYEEGLMHSVAAAAVAGEKNQPKQLGLLVEGVMNTTSQPQFIAAVGGNANAAIKRQEMTEKVVISFLQEFVQTNPVDAIGFVNSTEEMAAFAGIANEEASLMMEKIRKVAAPLVARELAVTSNMIDDEMKKVTLGYYTPMTPPTAFAQRLYAMDPNQNDKAAWRKLDAYQTAIEHQDEVREFTLMNQTKQRDTLNELKKSLLTDPSKEGSQLATILEKAHDEKNQAESSGNGLEHFIGTQQQYTQPAPVLTALPKDIESRIVSWIAYTTSRATELQVITGNTTTSRRAPPLIDAKELSQLRNQFSVGGATPIDVANQFEVLFESKFKGKLHDKEYETQLLKMQEQIGRFDSGLALVVQTTKWGRERLQKGNDYEGQFYPTPENQGRRAQ